MKKSLVRLGCTATPPEDGTPCPNSKYRITFQKNYRTDVENRDFFCTLSVPHSTLQDNGTWTLSFLSFENGLFVSCMNSTLKSYCFFHIFVLFCFIQTEELEVKVLNYDDNDDVETLDPVQKYMVPLSFSIVIVFAIALLCIC